MSYNELLFGMPEIPEATDEERRAYSEGRAAGMRDALYILFPKGMQNNDSIEELVRLLKSEKEGEE